MNNIAIVNIKKIRRQKDWSQEYVADKLNITQSAYAKLESGVSKLDILRLLEIAKLFGIHPSQLLVE